MNSFLSRKLPGVWTGLRDSTEQFLATRSQIITMNVAVSLRTKSVRYTCTWLDALEWCQALPLCCPPFRSVPRFGETAKVHTRTHIYTQTHISRRVHPAGINVSTLRHARAIRYASKNVNRWLISTPFHRWRFHFHFSARDY